jgi:hypothetical protein
MLASIFDEFYPFKTISGMSEREIYMRILNAKSRESRAKERRGV